MQIPHDSYVLVADGRKMLFFRNEGDETYPNLEVVKKEVQYDPATHDQGTDRPGRSAAGSAAMQSGMPATAGRSAYSDADFHQIEENRFAADAADMLKKGVLENEYEKLLIVAPSTTLGELRKHYHPEVKQRLVGEIPKDLTNHTVPEIEKIISES